MTREEKIQAFRIALRSEQNRNEADPYSDTDSYYFGHYDGIDDLLVALGLIDEYEQWKSEGEK